MNVDDTAGRSLARGVQARRKDLGFSQRRLAAEMVAAGCDTWTSSTVANVERQDKPRALTVEELGALCVALRCSLEDLLRETPKLAERLRGKSHEQGTTTWSVKVSDAEREQIAGDLVSRLAESLSIYTVEVERIAADLYGRSVIDERDSRLGDTPAGDPRDRAKRLGHFTRSIRDEMAEYLAEQELPAPRERQSPEPGADW